MSDGFRERFQGSAEYEVWQYIAQHPGLTSREIVHGVTTRREESVHRSLRSLRVKGVLHNAGELRDNQAWYLSQWGEECLRNGLIVSRGKHGEDPKVEVGERDWQPKPWVHPIRARILPKVVP